MPALIWTSSVIASFNCEGSLTEAQVQGFKELFKPPYSPSLAQIGPTVSPKNFSKKITQAQLQKLTLDKPLIVASSTLTKEEAKFLRRALNDNAQLFVPGWFSTVIGVFVPMAWIGVTADVMI